MEWNADINLTFIRFSLVCSEIIGKGTYPVLQEIWSVLNRGANNVVACSYISVVSCERCINFIGASEKPMFFVVELTHILTGVVVVCVCLLGYSKRHNRIPSRGDFLLHRC